MLIMLCRLYIEFHLPEGERASGLDYRALGARTEVTRHLLLIIDIHASLNMISFNCI
jgi:hypothetical protein